MFLDVSQSLIDSKTRRYEPPKREIGNHCTIDQICKYKEFIIQQYSHHNINIRAERLYERAQVVLNKPKMKALLKDLSMIDQ